MVRPPRTDRRSVADTPPVDGVRIVEAASAAEVVDFDQTLTEAYPADALLPYGAHPRLFTDGVTAVGWQLINAYLGDQPVATAGAFASDHVVAIEAVSTRPAFRGRGSVRSPPTRPRTSPRTFPRRCSPPTPAGPSTSDWGSSPCCASRCGSDRADAARTAVTAPRRFVLRGVRSCGNRDRRGQAPLR